MAQVLKCQYCNATVLNETVCKDCKRVLLFYAEKGEAPPPRERVAEESRKQQIDQMQKEHEELIKKLNNRCPHCGRLWPEGKTEIY